MVGPDYYGSQGSTGEGKEKDPVHVSCAHNHIPFMMGGQISNHTHLYSPYLNLQIICLYLSILTYFHHSNSGLVLLVVRFLHKNQSNPRKFICCGKKKRPKCPLFNLILLGLDWPWVGESVGFIAIFYFEVYVLRPQIDKVNHKHLYVVYAYM